MPFRRACPRRRSPTSNPSSRALSKTRLTLRRSRPLGKGLRWKATSRATSRRRRSRAWRPRSRRRRRKWCRCSIPSRPNGIGNTSSTTGGASCSARLRPRSPARTLPPGTCRACLRRLISSSKRPSPRTRFSKPHPSAPGMACCKRGPCRTVTGPRSTISLRTRPCSFTPRASRPPPNPRMPSSYPPTARSSTRRRSS